MPKGRLVFDGDNVYTQKDARIYKLKSSVSSKIDAIPGVVDSLDSVSSTDALSANMGKNLQDQINAVSGIGKFLSTWDCTTGLPGTNPQEDPYTYKVGDYYVVSAVGATNYKPHGATYTQGVPSTAVETDNVGVNDKYYFDGADWVRIPDTSIQISIDNALSTTSTNAVENRAIANAINTKQNTISDLSDIRSGAAAGATALQALDNITELTNNAGYQTAGDVTSAITTAIQTLAPDGVGTGVLTLQKNATTIDTFSANAVQNKTINITVPTTVVELSDASDYAKKTDVSSDLLDYTPTANLGAVALSNDYDDLNNKPTIPTVNNATLTIQKNSSNVATFTANSNTPTVANITVPTTVAELSDASDYATKTYADNAAGGVVSDSAFSSSWDGVTTQAPSKNAVYDAIMAHGNYNAGPGIIIGDYSDYSAMRGPCPEGYHVPLNTEWQAIYNIWTALGGGSSDGTNFGIVLKLPFAGGRNDSDSNVYLQGDIGYYWSSTRYNENSAYRLGVNSSSVYPQNYRNRAGGFSVRCFKDGPVIPTSSWTKLYGTSIETGGIFWSSTDGLISMSSDGITWITIADKNLGATTVWNNGDTLSEANCGKYYQRGNNYGFPFTGTIANQSTTQVDASSYGPGNYYSSDTFIKYNGRWDTTDNGNLRGGVTGGVFIPNAIYVDMDYINSHIN